MRIALLTNHQRNDMSVFHDQALFMRAMEQSAEPSNAPLYGELIREEVVRELLPALEKWLAAPTTENLIDVVDGGIDGIVVIAGLLNCLIGPDKAMMAWQEIQGSNLSKATFDHISGKYVVERRADGKVLKGPGYYAPNLLKTLTGIE